MDFSLVGGHGEGYTMSGHDGPPSRDVAVLVIIFCRVSSGVITSIFHKIPFMMAGVELSYPFIIVIGDLSERRHVSSSYRRCLEFIS